jgi:hypothetical protein
MKCRECNKSLNFSDENSVYFVSLTGTNDRFCLKCMPSMQPERLSGLESEMTMRQSEPSNERDGD